MTQPHLVSVALGENLSGGQTASINPELPLLVVGPSLGTSVVPLWSSTAALLKDRFTVVGWELPGHGRGTPATGFSLAELAEAVHELATTIQEERGCAGETYFYAGVSVGGSVGQELLLAYPNEVRAAALICTGAKIGTFESWTERADLVEVAGTPTQIIGSTQKWFAPGFLEKDSVTATELLHSLQEADRHSYGAVCRALAEFDVRDRLKEITTPVLTIAGEADTATPPSSLQEIADGVANGRAVVFENVAHLAPAENPQRTADELNSFFSEQGSESGSGLVGQTSENSAQFNLVDQSLSRAEVKEAGMTVRRQVLSDEHVDRAAEKTTAFTADFQDLISRYAWGEIWTRPGLDRRMRSAITLTAMIAHGHWAEFEMHVRSAIKNGLTVDEIKEIILQSAIYLGVPAANDAFGRAQRVLQELGEI